MLSAPRWSRSSYKYMNSSQILWDQPAQGPSDEGTRRMGSRAKNPSSGLRSAHLRQANSAPVKGPLGEELGLSTALADKEAHRRGLVLHERRQAHRRE